MNLNFKKEILIQLQNVLKKNYLNLVSTASEAHEAATNEESKAENKYDTRGLEASYLAEAQSKRAEELRITIDKLNKIKLIKFDEDQLIGLTALVQLEINDETKKWFFLLPFAGGHKIKYKKEEFVTITAQSPVGKKLRGKALDDEFELKQKDKLVNYRILKID